jgi:hypothetical protein
MDDNNILNLKKKNLYRQMANLLGTESFVTFYMEEDGNMSYIIDSEKIDIKELVFMSKVFTLLVDEIVQDAIRVEPHE